MNRLDECTNAQCLCNLKLKINKLLEQKRSFRNAPAEDELHFVLKSTLVEKLAKENVNSSFGFLYSYFINFL